MQRGFSLVELSIVLVILGLLTGGILAGQSLIRASELRAVSGEYQRWITATHTFRDKYFAIPGDMTNATAVWGKDNTNCTGHTGTAATPGTCNGNGDAILTGGGANATAEVTQYWKQLALAGMIEGSYNGLVGSAGGHHAVIGTNVPGSKMGGTGWSVMNNAAQPGNAEMWQYDYQNTMFFGMPSTNHVTYLEALKSEEAWNVDTKIDDGRPGIGKVMVMWNYGCTDATAFTQRLTASYALSTSGIICRFAFPRAF